MNTPAQPQKREPVARIAMMLVRIGFVMAAVLGVGMLAGLLTNVVMYHMVAGLLTLVGALLGSLRLLAQQKGNKVLLIAIPAIGILGVVLGMQGQGLIHMSTMIIMVALMEMSMAKARRA